MKADLTVLLSHTKQQDDCLLWTKCVNTDGYPRANVEGDVNTKVHRLVWELYNGKSANGFVIRHKCDNPLCINPKHLEIGTQLDNVQDRVLRGRTNAKVTKEQVVEIRILRTEGVSAKELAAKYGLTVRTIHSLLSKHHWKHV